MCEGPTTGPPGSESSARFVRAVDRAASWSVQIFLALVIMFPAMFRTLKIGILVALLLLAVLRTILRGGRTGVHPVVLRWSILFAGWGGLFTIVGLFNHAQGAKEAVMVYVLSPVAYLGVVALVDRRMLRRIDRLLVAMTLVIALLVIVKVLSVFGARMPILDYIVNLYPDEGFATTTDFAPRVLSNLLFLTPYTLLSVLLQQGRDKRLAGWVRILAALLSIFAALVAGRNAIVLILVLAPLYLTTLMVFGMPQRLLALLGRSARLAFLILLVLAVLNVLVPRFARWDLERTVTTLVAAFDPARDPGAATRKEQLQILVSSALESPLWGHGLGTQAGVYVRDEDKPWRYEIRYAALLHSTGFGGAFVYGLGVAWIYLAGLRVARRQPKVGEVCLLMLAALACVLTADWTNAYLAEVGNLWMLYLPIAAVNVGLLQAANGDTVPGA